MADPVKTLAAGPLPLKPAGYLQPKQGAQPIEKSAAQSAETLRLKEACDNFEALFMQQMLKQMRATVPRDGMFSGGSAEQIYTDMLDAELSKEMAGTGGLGISRLLFEHMTAAQALRDEIKD